MKIFCQALLVAVLGCASLAQKTPTQKPAAAAPANVSHAPASAAKPTAEQVMKLLDLMRIQDGLQITLDAMKDQIKAGTDQALREKILEPTPDQIKAAHGIVDEEFQKLSLDGMIKDIVPVYQHHFTRSDVDALVAFYSSPAGRKVVREQPAMLRESMQATASSQRAKMEMLLARLDLRVQQLIADEQNKTDPDKTEKK